MTNIPKNVVSSTSKPCIVAQLVFHDVPFKPVSHEGRVWLSATEIAAALGYRKSDAITQVYERNADEFTTEMTQTLKLRASGNYEKTIRIFSLRGAHLVAMFAKTPLAKEFRRWVLDILDREVSPLRKTTTDDRTPLRDAVNMLVSKKHLMYPEAYSIIHQRFAVDSIEDLTPEQIPQAIEYVHRVVLDGEYLGKQMELQTPSRQFTDEELCHLCWLWKYSARMVELIADITPLLRVAEHRLRGAYASASHEYPMHINKVRRILDRETAHIECSQFRSDNWRILRQMRGEHSAIR